MKNIDFNKLLLFFLIFTFPLSSKFSIIDIEFINIFAFRLLILLSIFFLIIKGKLYIPRGNNSLLLTVFTFYLIFYGLLSLIWVEDINYAIKAISHNSWGFLIVITMLSFLNKIDNPFLDIRNAWLIAFSFLAFFGLLEVTSSIHFKSNFTNYLETFDFARSTFNSPLATFSNPNDFAVFLVFTLIIYFIKIKPKNVFVALLVSALIIFLVLYTRSTISKIAMIYVFIVTLSLMVFANDKLIFRNNLNFILNRFSTLKNNLSSTIIIVGFVTFSIAYVLLTTPVVILNKADTSKVDYMLVKENKENYNLILENIDTFFEIDSTTTKTIGLTESETYNIRKNLFLNGLNFAKNSYFLGIGAGQFAYKTKMNQKDYPTGDKINPHSFFIEIISQYGIIPILILGYFFISILVSLFKNFKKLFISAPQIEANFLLLTIPVYLLLSNAPSTFKTHSINWIVLSLIAYSADKVSIYLKENKNA